MEWPVVIAEWSKSSREIFPVSLVEYNGKPLADCRIFYLADDETYRLSPKGLSVTIGHLPAMAAGLMAALETARRLGLLEGESHGLPQS